MMLNEVAGAKFTEDELMDLALMVHDKRHVMGSAYQEKVPALEKALAHLSKRSPHLWRGAYQAELKEFEIGTTFSPDGYMSMSEHKAIAERFGSKTKTILHIKGVKAFCYWRWNINTLQLPLKKSDPKAFHDSDGEHMIKTLKEEAEWIIGHDTKLEVISKHEADGFTIIELKEV